MVERSVPTKVIRVNNKDKPWFYDKCMPAYGLMQEEHLRWTRDHSRVNWEEFVHCQVRSKETYKEAKCQFRDRIIDVLLNVQSPHKLWLNLLSAVFGWSSSLLPLVTASGGLVCDPVGKSDLLSDHFKSNISKESVDRPVTIPHHRIRG